MVFWTSFAILHVTVVLGGLCVASFLPVTCMLVSCPCFGVFLCETTAIFCIHYLGWRVVILDVISNFGGDGCP